MNNSKEDEFGQSVEFSNTRELNIDEIIRRIGCGTSQYAIIIVCMFLEFTFGYHALIMYFVADDPPWKCTSGNNSFCSKNLGKEFGKASDDFQKRCHMNRSDWDFICDKKYSIVTEYDLVCSKTYLAALANASFFIGWAVGGLCTAFVSDRFGRKLCIICSHICLSIFAIVSTTSTSYWQFALLRSLTGMCFGTLMSALFTYVSEITLPEYRSLSLNMVQMSFSLSLICVSVLAMYVTQWRNLVLYSSFPGLLACVVALFVPESPRWLVTVGKTFKAEKVLKKMTRNGKYSAMEFVLATPSYNRAQERYSYFDLFRQCSLVLFVLAQAFAWFAVGLVYYTLSLVAACLDGSLHLNFIYSMVGDIVGVILTIFACNILGRRYAFVSSLLMAGVVLSCVVAVPPTDKDGPTIRLVFSVIGKAFVSLAFCALYLWSAELFPTVIRNQGITLVQIAGRIGSTSAPFIATLLYTIYSPMPFIMMAIISVLASITTLILPETSKKPTRERFEDMFENNDVVSHQKSYSRVVSTEQQYSVNQYNYVRV